MLERRDKAVSVTKTLVTVSVVFLLLTGPLSVYNSVRFWAMAWVRTTTFYRTYYRWLDEGLVYMTTVNSCVNFFLYSLTGDRFRVELKQVIKAVLPKPFA